MRDERGAIEGLKTLKGTIDGAAAAGDKGVVYLFTGQGAQYEGMGWGLMYEQEKSLSRGGGPLQRVVERGIGSGLEGDNLS